MYGVEVTYMTQKGINELEKEQLQIQRYLLGASKSACSEGIRGSLGWWNMKHRVNQVFLIYAKLFEWIGECWSKTIWEMVDPYNRMRRNRMGSLSNKYDIDMDKVNMKALSWNRYFSGEIDLYVRNEWMVKARLKSSLRYYAQSEEDYGRSVPLDGLWNIKAPVRLQIGDVMNADKRRHINVLDRGECLCCEEGNEDTIEHIIKNCKVFESDRIKISGRDGREGHENDEIR